MTDDLNTVDALIVAIYRAIVAHQSTPDGKLYASRAIIALAKVTALMINALDAVDALRFPPREEQFKDLLVKNIIDMNHNPDIARRYVEVFTHATGLLEIKLADCELPTRRT